jgi:F-type H+-transporting ATPase subunit delta
VLFSGAPFLHAGDTKPGARSDPSKLHEIIDVATDEPIMASVAGRYASALFELANEAGALTEVESQLGVFQAMMDESADLTRLVLSPVFSAEDQARAIAAVLDRAGIGGLTKNFLLVITRNRRLFAALGMIRTFRALAAKARGEVGVDVETATPLSGEHIEALTTALKNYVGKDIRLHTKVDPELLGGLVVKIGSRMIDSSVRTKLKLLEKRMKEVG